MKSSINTLLVTALAAAVSLCGAFTAKAQTVQLTVDPTQTWVGYMNATAFVGTNLFNSTYGTGALQAYFVGTNLILLPCTNVWETTDATYVQANGTTPNANMDANMYVQNDALVNSYLNFSGSCLSNTLTTQPEPLSGSNYTSVAFIKAFDGSYNLIGEATSNLIGGNSFSISLGTTNAAHVQYGFETTGPDANPATASSLGYVVIAVVPKTLPVPTNNAPVPTSPAPIVAMFDSSGVYPEVSVDDWDASWSDGAEANFTITNTGSTVLEYTALQYAGVEFYDPDQINTAGCNEMHVDVWTPNANQFGVELVSLDNGTQGAQVNFTPASGTIVSNTWISLNIPLSQFLAVNGALDLANLQQLLWIDNQGGGVDGGTFYIDNVYFYSNSALAPPPPPLPQPTTAAPTPPQQVALAMYNSSGVYSDVEVVDFDAAWSDPASGVTDFTITNTTSTVLEYNNLQYAGVEFYNDADDQIDVSSFNTMHVDVWTPDGNQFGIQLVSLDADGGNNTQAGQVNFTPASGAIVSNQWVSLDIPLSEFTSPQNAVYPAPNNNLDLTDLQQLLWIDNQGGGGVTGAYYYIDNVYFYNSSVAQPPQITFNIAGGTVNFSFPTEEGFNYILQYTTSLTNPSWQTLGSVSGNNYTQSLTDTPGQTRFYRIVATKPVLD
ncbi:MAG TPA: hypothetical protein VMF08_09425 [Candidatus Sulfotelmatobacter sp.]|nr:hypothetical protein [Candidatus Sulfotelmatobacter sp.]